MIEPADRWLEELGADRRRETYALGLSAPPELHAALAALAVEFPDALADLADPFFATYLAGAYRYGARERGQSDESLAASIWSTPADARASDDALRAVARHFMAVQDLAAGIRPYRDELQAQPDAQPDA